MRWRNVVPECSVWAQQSGCSSGVFPHFWEGPSQVGFGPIGWAIPMKGVPIMEQAVAVGGPLPDAVLVHDLSSVLPRPPAATAFSELPAEDVASGSSSVDVPVAPRFPLAGTGLDVRELPPAFGIRSETAQFLTDDLWGPSAEVCLFDPVAGAVPTWPG